MTRFGQVLVRNADGKKFSFDELDNFRSTAGNSNHCRSIADHAQFGGLGSWRDDNFVEKLFFAVDNFTEWQLRCFCFRRTSGLGGAAVESSSLAL